MEQPPRSSGANALVVGAGESLINAVAAADDVFEEEEIENKISLRIGVFLDAQMEKDVKERFEHAKIAADRVKDDPDKICGYYAGYSACTDGFAEDV